MAALVNQPEQYYLMQIISERLETDKDFASKESVYLYEKLCNLKLADAMAILINRYESFFKNRRSAFFLTPYHYSNEFVGIFDKIINVADARHADLIEKFIAEHPALAPLKDKVAAIRKRPAPAARVELAFRLGTQLVAP